MEMVIWRPGTCGCGLSVVPKELCEMLECCTGMGTSGCLGCRGAVSMDPCVVLLLFTRCQFTWLPPAARQNVAKLDLCQGIANAQHHRKVSWGQGPTVLPAVTWGPPSAGRFIGTGGIFHAMERVRLWPLGISIASSFYIPFSIPWAPCPRDCLPLPSPMSQNQKWDLDKMVHR